MTFRGSEAPPRSRWARVLTPVLSRGPRLLMPLRHRDFALLWSGMTVSLLGDGIYFVAIAWQTYALSNAPTALSLVGVAWMLPIVVFLLVGGAVTDRHERRRVLLIANLGQAVAIGAIGVLSVSGELRMGMLLVLVAVYGAGEAFSNPAFDAIVPTLVSPEDYTSASALDRFMRPFALQLLGPAIGGVLVAVVSPGAAFLVDAGTFLVSVAALSMMRRVPSTPGVRSVRAAVREVGEGLQFVRRNAWLWGTLAAASLSLLAFWGPFQVLLPFLVKNRLHAGGGAFGVIRASAGMGAILAAVSLAQRGLPRRCMTVMFGAWALESALLVGFAVATGVWSFAVISLLSGGLASVGNVIWGALMNMFVPNELRGRVSSVDWLLSLGLIPVSFALTGPIAEAVGARTTLLVAGALGGAAMIAFLAVPGVRDPEHRMVRAEPLAGPGLASDP